MGVKNSKTRSGFLIYLYFKDSVLILLQLFSPLLGFFVLFRGIY